MEPNAHDIALKYLRYQDRTKAEVEKHLKGKGCSRQEITETLDFLTDSKLINDEDYCERYIRYGMEKGRGPLRLERELLDKGLNVDVIRLGLETHLDSSTERELALDQAGKLLIRTEQNGEKELARIARHLSYQGYHTNVIYEVIGKLR